MSPCNTPSACLAGLDSIMFRYDTVNAQDECDLSCILLSTISRQPSITVGCFPLGPSKCISFTPCTTATLPSPDRENTLPLSSINRSERPPQSPVFHPLPPLPRVPSLQLPSFTDLQDLSPTSRVYRSYPSHGISSCQVSSLDSDSHLSHQNSPYVPWPSPVRQQFLHPASRVSLPSRSGARAPEPMTYDERDRSLLTSFSKMANKFQRIRRCVRKRVRSAAKLIHNPKRDVPPYHPSVARRDSVMTCDSVLTTSLDAWLALRRRESMDRSVDPSSLMTLEEYEARGSWLDLADEQSDEDTPTPTQAYASYLSGLSLRTRSGSFPPTPSVADFGQWRRGPSVPSSPMSFDTTWTSVHGRSQLPSTETTWTSIQGRHNLQSPLQATFTQQSSMPSVPSSKDDPMPGGWAAW